MTVEEYEVRREELLALNGNLTGVLLRESEKPVDDYLRNARRELLEQYKGQYIYDIPLLTMPELCDSKLYKFCSRMPKGAELHVHDMALLPFSELYELLRECPEFSINADGESFDLHYGSDVPAGYVRFADCPYSREELLEAWTVLGAERSGLNVWDFFETLFDRQGVLSSNPAFAAKYYDRAFRYYIRHGVIHIEIHVMLTDSIDESAEYARVLREAYYRVRRDYPYFTLRLIGAGVKADNATVDYTRMCFLNASYVQEVVKDEFDPENVTNFLIGFDLVNEEDTSLPLKAFVPMLLKVKRQYPDMKLYIHGGESLDASNENLIDAYLLGVSRVGHGLNLYRYPDLHSRYVRDEICLEVCPVSNQRLGYTRDIRNHPATEYLRSGMALALCSDDPAYMHRESLTDDFFAAVLGWNLGLADIKQLGINSILYSGLDQKTKTASLSAYNKLWNEFIKRYS